MSELQPSPREAVLSTALEDLTVPGVMIEVDPDEAEAIYKPIEHMLLHHAAADPWTLTALEIARALDELELDR